MSTNVLPHYTTIKDQLKQVSRNFAKNPWPTFKQPWPFRLKAFSIIDKWVHYFLWKYLERVDNTILDKSVRLTIHYIDPGWNLCNFLLDIIPFAIKHSGVNIAQEIMRVLEEFNIFSRIITLTTDIHWIDFSGAFGHKLLLISQLWNLKLKLHYVLSPLGVVVYITKYFYLLIFTLILIRDECKFILPYF